MRTYIDESGGFIPYERPSSRVSCVAAVVVPESSVSRLFDDFVALRSKFTASAEIKGSELTDSQLEAALWTLGRHDLVVEAAMIDAGAHTIEEIRRLRTVQGDKIVANLTAEHHPTDLPVSPRSFDAKADGACERFRLFSIRAVQESLEGNA